MRNFIFEWYTRDKNHEPIIRHVRIQTSDMKNAVYIFRNNFGSLKKNFINFIQEITPNGAPIGDKVIPYKDAIVY